MSKAMTNPLAQFLEHHHIEYYHNREISDFTTIHIGGKVRDIIVIRHTGDLEKTLVFLGSRENPYILLGGGSNVVFPDRGEKLTVIINRSSTIEEMQDRTLKVDAGVTIKDLLDWTAGHHAGGMEFLAGIPGTLGGAAAVNAGAFGKSISGILEKADIFSRAGKVETVGREYFNFSYRDSKFKFGSEVIIHVYLRFSPRENEEIKKEITSILKYRKENHPSMKNYSAGCFFKNPVVEEQKISAGKLIEQSGLKGTDYKELQVSEEHGNFLVNKGRATFADIDTFSERIRRQVKETEGILLEREVIFISPEGDKY